MKLFVTHMEHIFVIPPYLRSLVCIVHEDRFRTDFYWFVRNNNMYLSELYSTISPFHIFLVCYKIKIFINFIGIIKYQFHVMHEHKQRSLCQLFLCLQNKLSLTTSVVSSNPVHGYVYSIQIYVIQFVSDLRQGGGFLRVL